MSSLAVIVTAGGRGQRLPRGKLSADILGRSLLDRVLDGLPADAQIICVGPEVATNRTVSWTRETPAFAGPLSAVEAGADSLGSEVELVVLVGGDMPSAGGAVPALLAALDADCAAVVDDTGRTQPLLSAWRRAALSTRLAELAPTPGRALAALLDTVPVVLVDDIWGASDDVDTTEDLAAARERQRRLSP